MKDKNKKKVAPIIIAIILIAYLLIYVVLGILFKTYFFIIPAVIGIFFAKHVLTERLKEIENGEEDDLSKY